MYIVIMGGGRVGLALANLLIENGEDITLIESDEALCADVAAELDALVICGNGTNSKLLEETNIEDADFFIATTGNDEANLLSCILVRKYNVPHIIARVSNPDHEEAFKEVGIDHV
ncbi:MAG: TrkA family potassium uptake protein, partial [Methanobrevibacter sp.]|nr:TrkA family potassium uptake protein [Methanobrevibacter sp.]